MNRDASNTNSSKGQLRTLISGVASFMNKSSKSVKDEEHKAMRKSKQIAVIKEEEILMEADSYIVDEISHEDFNSYQSLTIDAPAKSKEDADNAKTD
jgi:hypothetical protein